MKGMHQNMHINIAGMHTMNHILHTASRSENLLNPHFVTVSYVLWLWISLFQLLIDAKQYFYLFII